MAKIKAKHLLMTITAAIFVLCGSMSMAQNEVPTICTTPGGWTIEFQGVSDPGVCEIDGQVVDPCYTWLYQVLNQDGTTKGLNHINFNIRVTQPEATLVGQSDDMYAATIATYDPGDGDPTIYFGRGILQYYVAKFTPQSTTGYWSFTSNSARMEEGTGGLKVNNNLELCKLAVPGDANYAAMAVSTAQNITTADHKNFRIVEDPYTQCILKAYEILPDGTERELTKSAVSDLLVEKGTDGNNEEFEDPIVFVGVPGQGCPRAIVKADGEHTWLFISGRWIWR